MSPTTSLEPCLAAFSAVSNLCTVFDNEFMTRTGTGTSFWRVNEEVAGIGWRADLK